MTRIVGLLVLIWLVIGAVAAGQRGYFTHASADETAAKARAAQAEADVKAAQASGLQQHSAVHRKRGSQLA